MATLHLFDCNGEEQFIETGAVARINFFRAHWDVDRLRCTFYLLDGSSITAVGETAEELRKWYMTTREAIHFNYVTSQVS